MAGFAWIGEFSATQLCLGRQPQLQIIELISKVCCCSSGENLNPVFSALFWAPTFAGMTLFNRFEISSVVHLLIPEGESEP